MVSLFAAIAGFVSSIFPELLKIFRDKNDKAHELAILKLQIEHSKLSHNVRLEEMQLITDSYETQIMQRHYKTNFKLIDALNASVRPILAYGFFGLYCYIKFLQFQQLNLDLPLAMRIDLLWSLEDQAIFAGIISFYFGQRTLNRFMQRRF